MYASSAVVGTPADQFAELNQLPVALVAQDVSAPAANRTKPNNPSRTAPVSKTHDCILQVIIPAVVLSGCFIPKVFGLCFFPITTSVYACFGCPAL
jgi:hypothetical protein